MDASVIIVNWNTGGLLRRCLDALGRAFAPQHSFEVVVVDNASSDESVTLARASAQPFRLVSLERNVGFSRANNVAIRDARGGVVILLNPDTEPRAGSLSALVDAVRAHPDAAAVGPRLISADGTLQRSCRRFPTFAVLALLFLKAHHLFPGLAALRRYEMRDASLGRERAVDQIMGACMAIPRRALDCVGLLDEGYWVWFEEVDWCRRAARAGLRAWFAPRSEVLHHGAASFRQVPPIRKEWRFLRSGLRYSAKHLGPVPTAALILLVPFALLLDAGAFFPWFIHSRNASPP